MRYRDVVEGKTEEARRRQAAEKLAKKRDATNDAMKRARSEGDPTLRAAKINSLNAQRQEAEAQYKKVMRDDRT